MSKYKFSKATVLYQYKVCTIWETTIKILKILSMNLTYCTFQTTNVTEKKAEENIFKAKLNRRLQPHRILTTLKNIHGNSS